MSEKLKKYETIGCCGIDCGLCPRFYTKGESACPGCGGLNFNQKHPACGVLTCCAVKKGLEVCGECDEFPCKRFDSQKDGYDSFVTHQKMFVNHESIRDYGIEHFLTEQKIRMDILNNLLLHFDDGRSKSFYCVSCALLPIEKLQDLQTFLSTLNNTLNPKEKSKLIRDYLTHLATSMNIDLKLRRK